VACQGWGRAQRSFAQEADALDQAEAIAEHIHSGRAAADHISEADKEEWAKAIELAGDTPLLTAMREWATVQDLTGANSSPPRGRGQSVTARVRSR